MLNNRSRGGTLSFGRTKGKFCETFAHQSNQALAHRKCLLHIESMNQDAPKPRKPLVEIDARWWALGVVDGFNKRPSQFGVRDQFSYSSGRVEGEAAREQGRTVDEVLEKYRSPYREAHFRPAPLASQPPKRGR
jgi:hypothetical protein